LPRLLKKLYSLSLWNTAAAGLNFLSNLVIAKTMGIAIFGELIYLSSLTGIFTLIATIIPSNYSIIRYQDDPDFKFILARFYMIVWFLLMIPVIIFQHWVDLPFWLFYLYVFSTSIQGFFDISFQAENRLNRYYSMLFVQAIVKISLIILVYMLANLTDFRMIVLLIVVSQLSVSTVYLYQYRNVFIKKRFYLIPIVNLIWDKRKLFVSYYLNIGLKRISSNLIILLFEPMVSKEILGVYGLLLKVIVFIQGLIRTIESIFLVKENYNYYATGFLKNGLLIGFVLQLMHIAIGMVYMKYLDGSFYTAYIVGMSFLCYPFVFYVKSRAFFLTQFQNLHINISYIIFLLITIMIYGLSRFEVLAVSLSALVILFTISSAIQMVYLIIVEKMGSRMNLFR
jgi:hypothetical protein